MYWSKELNVWWVGVDTMIAISFEVDICSQWIKLLCLNKPSLVTWLELANILKGQRADMGTVKIWSYFAEFKQFLDFRLTRNLQHISRHTSNHFLVILICPLRQY